MRNDAKIANRILISLQCKSSNPLTPDPRSLTCYNSSSEIINRIEL
jgi:hypothetical protein